MNLASASVLTVCTLINHSSTGKSLGCSGITLALSTNQAPILAIPTIQILIFDQCVLFQKYLAIPTIQILYLTRVYFFPEILGNTNHTNTLFDQCVLFPRNTWQDWPLRNVDFLSSTNPMWASVHHYTSVQTNTSTQLHERQTNEQSRSLSVQPRGMATAHQLSTRHPMQVKNFHRSRCTRCFLQCATRNQSTTASHAI